MADSTHILTRFGDYFQSLHTDSRKEDFPNHPQVIFACHAVFPSLLTSDLLYQIWFNFRTYTLTSQPEKFQSIPFEAVNDFIHSELCREVGSDQYKVDHALRADLIRHLDLHVDGNRSKHLAYFLEKYGEYNQSPYYQTRIRPLHKDTAEVTLFPEKAQQKIQQSIKSALELQGNKHLDLIKLKMRLEQHAHLKEEFQELNDLVGYSLRAMSGKKQNQFLKLDYLRSNEAEGVFVAEKWLGGINTLIDKSRQNLSEFPMELLKNPNSIISLDLSHNQITRLPVEITQLKNLEYLNLNNNPGLDLGKVDWSKFESLRELKLNRLNLTRIPPSVFLCPKLEKFECYRNQIQGIPKVEEPSETLRHLDFSHNRISSLPDWLFSLTGLACLYLENNRLKAIPERIASLSQLKILHLKDNSLKQLPESMRKLTGLQPNIQEKDFQKGFTLEGNNFGFPILEGVFQESPLQIIAYVLERQQALEEQKRKEREQQQRVDPPVQEDRRSEEIELGNESMPERVVMIMAFNSESSGSSFLSDLRKESIMLDDLLAMEKNIHHIILEYPTLERIVNRINRYRGEIQIFHFSRHADSDGLILSETRNTRPTFSEGLVRLLATEEKLKLVFLNRTANQNQVKEFLDAGIPCVIAGDRAVNDQVSVDFSAAFYQNLVRERTIKQAFERAKAEISMRYESFTRKLFKEEKGEGLDEFPYSLYTRDQESAEWSIGKSIRIKPLSHPDREIIPRSYLLCGRLIQTSQFEDELQMHLRDFKWGSPFHTAIYGTYEELPRSLLERFTHFTVQNAFNRLKMPIRGSLLSEGLNIRKFDLESTRAKELFRMRMRSNLAERFDLSKVPENMDDVLARLPRNTPGVFVNHFFNEELDKEAMKIYSDYIHEFWRLDRSIRIPVIISHVFEEPLSRGLRNIFNRNPFQKMVDSLEIDRENILPKLSPVERNDVIAWQHTYLERNYELVSELFGPKNSLPMIQVEPFLRRVIDKELKRRG